MDFLKHIGANLDLSTGKLFSYDSVSRVESRNIDNRNKVDKFAMHNPESKLQAAETKEHRRLSLDARDDVPTASYSTIAVWCVTITQGVPLPPMSEVLIQGRLKIIAHEKVLAPVEVIVEPVELNIHGVRAARLLSKVGRDVPHVIVKAINFSKETLTLPKNCTLGIAESHGSQVVDRSSKQ